MPSSLRGVGWGGERCVNSSTFGYFPHSQPLLGEVFAYSVQFRKSIHPNSSSPA